jgi:hypothetical protein
VTLYYVCGSYTAKGNAGCARALAAKEEFEGLVLSAIAGHVSDFVTTGGAGLLAQLVEEAKGERPGERELRERLRAEERRLDEFVASLTPALAPVLEARIVAQKAAVDATRARLAEAERRALDAREAEALVADIVGDLARVQATLTTAPLSELRAAVRGIASGVKIDPETGEVAVRLYAIPQEMGLSARRAGAMSSGTTIAGARSDTGERTGRLRIRRRLPPGWTLRRSA